MDDKDGCPCSGLAGCCTAENAWQMVEDFADLVLSDEGDEVDLLYFPEAIQHALQITRRERAA
jgi:hypothetical protein